MEKRGRIVILGLVVLMIIVLLLFSVLVVSQEEKKTLSFGFDKNNKFVEKKNEGGVKYELKEEKGLNVITIDGKYTLKIDPELSNQKLFQKSLLSRIEIKGNTANLLMPVLDDKGNVKELKKFNVPLDENQIVVLTRLEGAKSDSVLVTAYSNNMEKTYKQFRKLNPTIEKGIMKESYATVDFPERGIVYTKIDVGTLTVLAGGVYEKDLDLALKEGTQGNLVFGMKEKNKLELLEADKDAKISRENVGKIDGKKEGNTKIDLEKDMEESGKILDKAKEKLSKIKKSSEELKPKKQGKVKRVRDIEEAATMLGIRNFNLIKNVGVGDEAIFTTFGGSLSTLAGIKAGKLKPVIEKTEEGTMTYITEFTEGKYSPYEVRDILGKIAKEADKNRDGLIDTKEFLEIQRKIYSEALGEKKEEQN